MSSPCTEKPFLLPAWKCYTNKNTRLFSASLLWFFHQSLAGCFLYSQSEQRLLRNTFSERSLLRKYFSSSAALCHHWHILIQIPDTTNDLSILFHKQVSNADDIRTPEQEFPQQHLRPFTVTVTSATDPDRQQWWRQQTPSGATSWRWRRRSMTVEETWHRQKSSPRLRILPWLPGFTFCFMSFLFFSLIPDLFPFCLVRLSLLLNWTNNIKVCLMLPWLS